MIDQLGTHHLEVNDTINCCMMGGTWILVQTVNHTELRKKIVTL